MAKKKMVTKSMKYRIKFNKDLYDTLRDIQYDVWRIKNKSTTMIHDWQQFSFSYNERFGEYPKDSKILGKSVSADIYAELKHMGENIASSTYNTAVKESIDKYNEQKSEMLRGNVAIVNYKRNGSFPIRATQIKDIEQINSKTFSTKLSLLSMNMVKKLREELKEENVKKKQEGKEIIRLPKDIKTQIPVTLMSGYGATEIMERIISGDYKLCDSRITTDRKNRFYLSIAYQFPQEEKQLDKNKIMGIDIGVNIPAMLALSDNKYYRQSVGDGKEILNFQNQMKARYRRLQQSRKWAGQGSRGRGRDTFLKPLERLSGKIARFKDHKNHVWSRYVVDEAVRNDCGVIQMEDLSGIAENSAFLKSWTYYDLQEKIRYKAEEIGIEVIKVKPDYTSQRCNRCGVIHKENRDAKKDQSRFECKTCNHKDNADANAAKNIAMKDIEKIIAEQLKFQDK